MFRKSNPRVGAMPGTLVISKQSPPPKLRLMRYDSQGVSESDIENLGQLESALSQGGIAWLDVQGFGDQALIEQIGEFFKLHPLLLEDVINVPSRPKVEEHGEQLLLILRMVRLLDGDELDVEQVSVVLGPNWILTFQERHGDVLDPVRRRIRSQRGGFRKRGCDYLFYAIADTIIDAYYPVLESQGEYIESLEDEVVSNPDQELLQRLNHVKNRLVNLRRAIWPQTEAFNALVRGDFEMVSESVRKYLRDTYDHSVQTSEVTEMYREMMTGLMGMYLSAVSNRTNEVMKVLTIMASVFIPITFIAGVYGMNFQDMPELHMRWAYPMVWMAMLGTAGGMLAYFWRKGWLG